MFYLDNAATTFVWPEVLEKSLPYLKQQFGNPSSIHNLGVDAARGVKSARQTFAQLFHMPMERIVFCSSGTEANHLALWGIAYASGLKGNQIIVSSIEHPCVLRNAEALQRQGFQVDYIRSLPEGIIDIAHLESLISGNTRLVSCMAVNNEIGTRQPLEEIGKIIKQKNPHALFHVDAVQAFTKIPLAMKSAKIDMVAISGHKIGAPKGIGSLIFDSNVSLSPVIWGGGQEHGIRSGTENVFGIVAFGEAAYLGSQRQAVSLEEMRKYKLQWLNFLEQECPQVHIFQSPYVLPHYLNLSIPPIPAEVFLHHLEAEGIYVSTGSACSSKKVQISHVLQAIGLNPTIAQSMIRLSFSKNNISEDRETLFQCFFAAVKKLDKLL